MSSSKIMDATRAPSVSGAGTLSWLSEQGLPSRSWRQAIERAGLGLLLSAAYGLALGTRAGGLELLRHGLALPVTLGLMALITVPAL
ncbi:MAG: hypothetical protein OEY14_13270, partial [Myxococcales bacterium]|nr:hypothetical protein [Myxococcales bacterium]